MNPNDYDALVAKKRAERLNAMPHPRKFREIVARFRSNAECGCVIQPGERFFYCNPGDGKGGWRCCKSCHAERDAAEGRP